MQVELSRGRTVPADELRWAFARSSGPGGQSVNTTDSSVRLSWDVASSAVLRPEEVQRIVARLASRMSGTVLAVTASAERSQLRNRERAAARMSQLLAEALAPPPRSRRPTRPSRASQQRRRESKRRRSQLKANRRRPAQ